MASEGILDNDLILHNILIRLPSKPLLRFRSVSKHWNHLITNPYFMKTRSRRMIILPTSSSILTLIDTNVPIDDTSHSKITLHSPFQNAKNTDRLQIIGTFNGIVLLLHNNTNMILYNPLTRASKKVPDPPKPSDNLMYTFGFCYGATLDDLKIVRIGFSTNNLRSRDTCNVFDFKKNSWSKQQVNVTNNYYYYDVGTFLNGFLYWVILKTDRVILALNVKDMVFSEINIPRELNCAHLGSQNGCLCMISENKCNMYKVWVMKEHGVDNSWSKVCSFKLPLEGKIWPNHYDPVYILDQGRILMKDASGEIYIYDTSKYSCKKLNVLGSVYSYGIETYGVEYFESLVSPSDMC